MKFLSPKNKLIILGIILLIAGIFRFWQIFQIPPGLYPDEAINGNDAWLSLTQNKWSVFYPENNGREGLFIWLIALSLKIFGPQIWAIRIVSAVIGFLTVLGMYYLAKEIFKSKPEIIALLSSFFLAVSFWHTNFSRIGFRAILVPFCLVWGFYFWLKAKSSSLQFKSLPYLLFSAFILGLGFYTYIAFRFVFLIIFFLVLVEAWLYLPRFQKIYQREKRFVPLFKRVYLKDGWWKWDAFFLVIFFTLLPLVMYFLIHPADFMSRASGVAVWSAENPLKELIKGTFKTLAMFNFAGDFNWRHNYAGRPMLSFLVGLWFILGLILFLKNWWENLKNVFPRFKKEIDQVNFIKQNLVLAWFGVFLLPAILTREGLPHSLRTIGVIPVVYLWAGLGAFWFLEKIKKNKPKLAYILLILILIQPMTENFYLYFFKWGKNPEVAGAFRQDLVNLGIYLNSLDKSVQKYVIVNEPGVPVPFPDGLPMPVQTIMFVVKDQKSKSGNQGVVYLKPEEIKNTAFKKPAVIVLLKDEEKIFFQLKQMFPLEKTGIKNGFRVFWLNKTP